MRILYWNIENFSLNKIGDPRFNKRQKGASVNKQASSADRREYILDTVASLNPIPDIIVVVENETSAGNEGTVINGNGDAGAVGLLMGLREDISDSYMLIPGLISGTGRKIEGISVYYRHINNLGNPHLYFTGPWSWPGGAGPAAAGAGPAPYDEPWIMTDNLGAPDPTDPDNTLPDRQVSPNSPINANANEYELAGQWNFMTNPAPGMGAPAQIDFPAAGYRRPFMVTFWDNTGNRTIRLTAFHAPPDNNLATQSIQNMAQIPDIIPAAGASEVSIIVGDFNLDSFTNAAAYAPLTNAGFAWHLDPAGIPNAVPNTFYYTTHMKPGKEATPWSDNGYPGYGFMGSSAMFPGYDCIDQVFSLYGTGVNSGGPVQNLTILNRVTSSTAAVPNNRATPYVTPPPVAAFPPAPGATAPGVPLGTQITSQYLNNPIALGGDRRVSAAGRFNAGRLKQFKGWNNYGCIRSTSDHIAIVFDC